MAKLHISKCKVSYVNKIIIWSIPLEIMDKMNFVNGDWTENIEDPNDPDTYMSTMGCRTLIGKDRHGCGYKKIGRGNNNPITIILPKLGIEHGICLGDRDTADIDGFFKSLRETLELVEKAHMDRWQIMKRQSPAAAPFMYRNGTIVDADKCKDDVYEALKHNTFSIGYLGVAEMCRAMFGKSHSEDAEIRKFAVSVVKMIHDFCKEASERNDLNYTCYAAPAESLCRTAITTLRKQYGVIENITSRDYLTNSHHCSVWEDFSIVDKLRIEAEFCKYPTAGTITYVELDSTFMNNIDAIESIIDFAFKELNIPYLAFNFPIDTCVDCGYQSEFNAECPECGSQNIQQLRRVTGYLTTDYRNFNVGKQAEVKDRVKHEYHEGDFI